MGEKSIPATTFSPDEEKTNQLSMSERISIFISSSMRDEGSFSWSKLRSSIYEEISRVSLFYPFAIEHRASMQRSRSLYISMIERCDIVVSIIKGELRPGTEEEIRCAIDRNKPLLLILIGEDRDIPTRDLLDYIQSVDYATYAIRKPDSEEHLSRYIVDQLFQAIVDLVKNESLEHREWAHFGAGVGDNTSYAIPQTTLALFGDSSFLLAEHLGLKSNSMQSQGDNPYLADLGRAAVSWLVDGSPFSLECYIPTIALAMKSSGIPEKTLELRLHALDAFLAQNYSLAFETAQVARKSLSQKTSWLYGNCLIDERNLSQYALDSWEEKFNTIQVLQNKITSLNTPVVFPLAEKYRSSAFDRILRATRKFRLKGVDTTIIGDNTLSAVLVDLSCYAFVSLLYGSMANFEASRLLLAHSLLDYSAIHNDQNLAFEGVRLLVLGGDCQEFQMQFKPEKGGISNYLKAGADELWKLSGRCPSIKQSNMKCVLVSMLAPYFSEEVFEGVEEYLTSDIAKFEHCRKSWVDALNSIKLRMNRAMFLPLVTQIVTEHLYMDARKVGIMIAGYDLNRLSKDELKDFAAVLESHYVELRKEGMNIETFAVVEKHIDGKIVHDSQIAELNDFERGMYLANKRDNDDSAVLASARELLRQYKDNNNPARYTHFAYMNAPIICSALDKGCSAAALDEIEMSLQAILDTISSYKGLISALDEPLKVLCKFACFRSANKVALPKNWTKQVASICVDNYSNCDAGFFCNYARDVLRVRIDALKVASGIGDSLSFLVGGVSITDISVKAQLAYLESLEWLIASGCIPDEQSVLVSCVCEVASRAPFDRVRKNSTQCIAACYNRWGIKRLEQAIYTLANDPADDVAFSLFSLSKEGSFGNKELERRIVEIMAESANWFIRWHAQND